MEVTKRSVLRAGLGAASAALARGAGAAEAYPVQPVRIVVGQSPGSGTDTAARLLGQWLYGRLGQPFVVDNQAGAAGNLATAAVARAPADGYTLLTAISANAINETLYENLNFSFVRDIAPIAGIFRVPQVMAVRATFPAATVPEFIAYAKANPGEINMASSGVGSVQHVAGELFKHMAGVAMTHVPYRGSTPALADLLAGQVDVMFDVTSSSAEYVKTGKLKGLAVTTAEPVAVLPGVPVLARFLPGFESSAWVGLAAPRATPPAIVDLLNAQIDAGLSDPAIALSIGRLGAEVLRLSPAEFAKLIRDDAAKWADVIRTANIKI